MSWETYYRFPVSYRRWVMKRLNKELSDAQNRGQQQMPSHAAHHNDPGLRQMMGQPHPNAPPKLRRF